jgi:hypothetical protein
MSRARLVTCVAAVLIPACSLITQLDPIVERDGSGGDGDADGEPDGDADGDTDTDGNTGGDADGDTDGDADCDDLTCDCSRISFSLEDPLSREETRDVSLAFGYITDDSYPDAVTAGQLEEGYFNGTVILYESDRTAEGVPSSHRRLDLPSAGDGLVPGGASIGNLDNDADLEIAVFSSYDYRGGGELTVVNNIGVSNTFNSVPVARPLTGGTLANLGDDPCADVIALAYDPGIGTDPVGGLVVWVRTSPATPIDTIVPLEVPLGEDQPLRVMPVGLNGDDDDEIVVSVLSSESGTNRLQLFEWDNEETTLVMRSDVEIACTPVAMAGVDIDGEGQPEILYSCGSHEAPDLHAVSTGGEPSLGEVRVIPGVAGPVRALAVGDLDGDTDIDIVTHDGGRVHVYCNSGRGDFTEVVPLGSDASTPASNPMIGIVDVNGDEEADLVVFHDGGISVFRGGPGS